MAPFRKRSASGGYSRKFTALFLVFLVLSTALWLFYRWLFNSESSLLTVGVMSLGTAWLWAYLFGYGADQHTGN